MPQLEERVFKKGEIIYRQNDYQMCLYDILYGSVALYQDYGKADEQLVIELDAGGYFGELELIEARPRMTTAIAKERTHVKIVTSENFGLCFQECPSLVLSIMQQMSARIRALERSYNDACRVVAESVDAERNGREKSYKLQRDRQTISELYHSYIKFFGR